MKRTIRIVLALGLMAAFVTAPNPEPAAAADTAPDTAVRERSPNPCSMAANLKRHWESMEDELQRLQAIEEDLWEPLGPLLEEYEALRRETCDEFICPRNIAYHSLMESLAELAEEFREGGDTESYSRLIERMNELENAYDDYMEAHGIWGEAWQDSYRASYEYWDVRTSWWIANQECELTHSTMNFSDFAPLLDEPRVDHQMQNPMGSDGNPSGVEGYLEIPVAIPEQEQTPQSGVGQLAFPETEATPDTPARTWLFSKPSRRSTPGEAQTQSTPAATGQTMQVQQQGSISTGSSDVGYSNMSVPQNAGQSGQAVAPIKTLKAVPQTRPMRLRPGRSIKW